MEVVQINEELGELFQCAGPDDKNVVNVAGEEVWLNILCF